MKRIGWLSLMVAGTAMVSAAELPVTSITLYSSGVGFFERAGAVQGEESLVLSFSPDQVVDVIRSMVYLDQGGGSVASASYESREPLSRILSTFRVDLSDNPGLGELLNRMRGETMTFATAGRTYEGQLVGVEEQVRREDDTVFSEYRVTFLVDGALVGHDLSQIQSLSPQDPALRRELATALSLVADGRTQDRKILTLQLQGEGERPVRLGYLMACPVWKTSYRMLVSEGKVSLQGWAHVDNPSDEDWEDVQLSLVSGQPVSFIQNLYDPIYAPRPVVPYETVSGAAPQTFGNAVGSSRLRKSEARREYGAAAAPAMILADAVSFDAGFAEEAMVESALPAASGGEVGELFAYKLDERVTVPRRQSAMLPILFASLDATPLSIYRFSAHASRPMNGILFTNDSPAYLMRGPVSVLEDGIYAGDALLEDTAQGQERLLTYAMDLGLEVTREPQAGTDELTSVSIVDGMLTIRRALEQKVLYRVNSSRTDDRTLMIEHPRRTDWQLVVPGDGVPMTASAYRFLLPVHAGGTVELPVVERKDVGQTLALTSLSRDQVVYYLDQRVISGPVRKALTTLGEMQAVLNDLRLERETVERRIREISEEQVRIRENMKAVARGSDSFAMWEGKLVDQEKRLDDLKQAREKAFRDEQVQQKKLREYVQSLEVD
ncbi:MAG: hypothetical protein KDL31_06905 [Kiritimatiellae bacterium]|nr:hypothetical protein [Kiritimatiellia bacterium]